MALISVISFFALPTFSWLDTYMLTYESEKLAEIFWYLRHKAMVCGNEQELVLDEFNGQYVCNSHMKYMLDRRVIFGYLDDSFGPPSDPKYRIMHAVTMAGGRTTIVFKPNGTITPVSIYLVTKKRTYMMAVTVPVAHTSIVRIYRYHKNTWLIQN